MAQPSVTTPRRKQTGPEGEDTVTTVARKDTCCGKACLADFPITLLHRTHRQMAVLSPEDKNMFLLGKISTSIDQLDIKGELMGRAGKGTPTYYHFDKNHVLCRAAFETVYGLSPKQLRVLREHLIEQREEPVPALNMKGKPYKKPPGSTPVKPVPVELPPRIDVQAETVKEMKTVEMAIKESCCQLHCWSNIPATLIALTRVQMRALAEHEKQLYLLGKMSHSVSLLPSTEIVSGGKRAMYVLDRDTIVCSSCFQYIHDMDAEKMRRIRYCLFENGISLDLPSLDSSPPSAQEASRKRKAETESEKLSFAAAQILNDKECCKRRCVQLIPREIIEETRTQIKHLTSTNRHMFLLGKLSGGVGMVQAALLGEVQEDGKDDLKKFKKISTYRFDKDHNLCKESFHAIYSVSEAQLTSLKQHLMEHGIERTEHKLKGRPSNAKGKKHTKRTKNGETVVEPSLVLDEFIVSVESALPT